MLGASIVPTYWITLNGKVTVLAMILVVCETAYAPFD